ncbi:unnamed protein product [Rotaria sordida]|uniref:Uncharacterized protein n=1 Tax=Rotaria sordida TaxID=392033 RepID=A0A814HWC4_9BILA|nr:unnamed protein product [Rotaria sordida]CAF1123855.1 unnamed protein product [Rotaria sordida]CAF1124766.1 unnamed protein product [Rotaria sordida]CAF1136722.1 unnamed protein product [Rotaria sordida]CAF3936851.1 unnamed protein product [Rotaria sordida]
MSINRGEIVGRILIGLGVIISSTILIITVYLLYRYKKESFNINKYINYSNNHRTNKQEDKLININNEKRSISILKTPIFIEELMRKSLELAITAEKIADDKQKRISLKDNIHLYFEE